MSTFYTYRVVPTGMCSWGVECVETADRVEYVSADFREAELIALRFTECQLFPVHLRDAIDDCDYIR